MAAQLLQRARVHAGSGRCELDLARPLLGRQHEQLGVLLEQLERTGAACRAAWRRAALAPPSFSSTLSPLRSSGTASRMRSTSSGEHRRAAGGPAGLRPRRAAARRGVLSPRAPCGRRALWPLRGAGRSMNSSYTAVGLVAGLAVLADAADAAALLAQADHQRREVGVGRHQHDHVAAARRCTRSIASTASAMSVLFLPADRLTIGRTDSRLNSACCLTAVLGVAVGTAHVDRAMLGQRCAGPPARSRRPRRCRRRSASITRGASFMPALQASVSPPRSGLSWPRRRRQLSGRVQLSRRSVIGAAVARQAVEVGAVEAGEAFQLVQRAGIVEGLGVQLHRRMRGVAAGAAQRRAPSGAPDAARCRCRGRIRRCRWWRPRPAPGGASRA